MARKRGRITVQNQPTGGERFMLKGIGLIHAVMGLIFVIVGGVMTAEIGLFGLPFLLGGLFFAANGIRMVVAKNDFAHRVGYDVETDLDRSIVGVMEDVDRMDSASASDGTEERLLRLQRLYDQRLITAEEYQTKRQEILNEL